MKSPQGGLPLARQTFVVAAVVELSFWPTGGAVGWLYDCGAKAAGNPGWPRS